MQKTSSTGSACVIFDHVWKQFHRGERHDSLRDLLPALASRLFRYSGRPESQSDRFWALKDVSFEVRPGQALGIIGPNGAGKSTTLKLLTRILKPTRGYCEVHGRIGALIEIAAGFHPDLTGRENVYLQGAVMGMKRAEIARKFTEIVEFSGVGDFIDTQVKRYSSGMNTRLGFSIAAHLDPEVLLIDEVLAVGDLAFQQKAFDRISEIVHRDIPVIVVSHQLERIASLCSLAILLDRGGVVRAGTPSECIAAYVQNQAFTLKFAETACSIYVHSIRAMTQDPVPSGEYLAVLLECSIVEAGKRDSEEIILRVRSMESGQMLFTVGNAALAVELPRSGRFCSKVELQMNVQPGMYLIETLIKDHDLGKYLAKGPYTSVRVSEGRAFLGTVQLNPRMEVLQSDTEAVTISSILGTDAAK